MARLRMSDMEWAFFEPLVVARGPRSGRPPADHRLVLDGVFWIARTGAPWRDLPAEFGKWSSVYRQFRRWTLEGLWDRALEALGTNEDLPHMAQMIDSTTIRAHHHAAGAKGGLARRILAVRAVAFRPNCTFDATPKASHLSSR